MSEERKKEKALVDKDNLLALTYRQHESDLKMKKKESYKQMFTEHMNQKNEFAQR